MFVYNDLTRQKETFEPLEPGKVKLYVCGPTVYDLFHLGNARPFIVFDTLRRYLEYRGFQVTYVQNFTDIDDKVIRRAQEMGISCQELTEKMIQEYFKDADGLNVKRATVYPKATECIPEIVALIKSLEDKGLAYVLSDGVYFDTAKDPDYGKLSGHPLEDEEQQQRVAHNQGKHSPNDFALWKFKKEGEPAWESPWGEGRPGWHIECSAMNKKYLGDTIDIHGGGKDLIFPHHENEIAQSESANGKPFVRYWMHNGFINIDNQKMSKSVGNFFRVRDLVAHYPYQVIRFFMLQAHYRAPINFGSALLESAQSGFERIVTCAKNIQFQLEQKAPRQNSEDKQLDQACQEAVLAFQKAMDDDLNTADAFAAIFDLVRELNRSVSSTEVSLDALQKGQKTLLELLSVLGLDPLMESNEDKIPEEIQELAQQRVQAKKDKQYQKADELRALIQEKGWKIEDTAQGPRLSRM